MKTLLKVLLVFVLLVVLLGAGGFLWAKRTTAAVLARTIEVHQVDFPIPFPLEPAEVEELGLSADEADALAMERAIERGQHLVEARYVCVECHGADFGGGVMVDDPMIGSIFGPNITMGEGGRTGGYTTADWDRIVRHGVRPDGHPAAMPSEDFQRMSDEELSDVIVYIRSQPDVDGTVPELKLGPLGTVLMATGALPLSADKIPEHQAAHMVRPPATEVSVEFGRHVAGVCMGCHAETLVGGPIAGGDPSWPAASNLTPVPEGLGSWSAEQFATVMRTGVRPDGTELLEPMSMVVPYTSQMTEVEMEALWAFLQSLPPTPPTR